MYAPVAHWVWAPGGWLRGLGVLDFAGGTVVHINAAAAALVGAILLGRRRGLRTPTVLPHNVPFAILGMGLLWFGWLGFNGGSALAANGLAGTGFVNTFFAPAAAARRGASSSSSATARCPASGSPRGAVAGMVAIIRSRVRPADPRPRHRRARGARPPGAAAAPAARARRLARRSPSTASPRPPARSSLERSPRRPSTPPARTAASRSSGSRRMAWSSMMIYPVASVPPVQARSHLAAWAPTSRTSGPASTSPRRASAGTSRRISTRRRERPRRTTARRSRRRSPLGQRRRSDPPPLAPPVRDGSPRSSGAGRCSSCVMAGRARCRPGSASIACTCGAPAPRRCALVTQQPPPPRTQSRAVSRPHRNAEMRPRGTARARCNAAGRRSLQRTFPEDTSMKTAVRRSSQPRSSPPRTAPMRRRPPSLRRPRRRTPSRISSRTSRTTPMCPRRLTWPTRTASRSACCLLGRAPG